MPDFTLALANRLLETALGKARDLNLQPLTAVVLDAGGHVIASQREDGAGFMRYDVAFAKAYGALGMGYGTRDLAKRAVSNASFYSALFAVSQGRMAPSPGGVLIRDVGGKVVGAVGISGDTGDNDELCAIAGLEAGEFIPDTGV